MDHFQKESNKPENVQRFLKAITIKDDVPIGVENMDE